ncbi:MAG: HDOD domain-containing protein, partial [Bryobacteraceae bacterium]
MTNVETTSARDKLLRSLDRLPPFSPILDQTLANLAKEDVEFGEIADLIEKDTVLAGNLLRLANSALFGLHQEVNSARHAIAIAGIQKVRNTVLALSVTRMWWHPPATPAWRPGMFSLHSAATATLCDMLAQRVPVEYPEGAFIAGLFHDLGKLLIANELPRVYEVLRTMDGGEENVIQTSEAELAGITHAELSAAALERWKLPPPIRKAVLDHHSPEKRTGEQRSLGEIVHY